MRFNRVLHLVAPLGIVTAAAVTMTVLAPHVSAPVGPLAGAVSPELLRTSAEPKATAKPTFRVHVGSLTGLAPGAGASLPVEFENPFKFGIQVVSYAATAAVPDTSTACPASNLVVPSETVTLQPPSTVPAGATSSITVPVSLSADAPAACQRVAFTVTISAMAVNK